MIFVFWFFIDNIDNITRTSMFFFVWLVEGLDTMVHGY